MLKMIKQHKRGILLILLGIVVGVSGTDCRTPFE